MTPSVMIWEPSVSGDKLWSPSELEFLAAWWDATDSSTLYDAETGGSNVTTDGTAVRRWEPKDAGTQGVSFNWTSDSTGTVYETNEVNGNPLIVVTNDRFISPYDSGSTDGSTSGFYVNTSLSLFMLLRPVDTSVLQEIFSTCYPNPGTITLHIRQTTTTWRCQTDTFGGNRSDVADTHDIATPVIVGGFHDVPIHNAISTDLAGGISGDFYGSALVSVDGTTGPLKNANSTYTMPGPTAAPARVGLMSSRYGANQDGAVGEIIASHENMSTYTRQKVEGYLAHKWGMTANLPASHPYKTDHPIVDTLWTPSQLSSVRAWYDMKAETGYSGGDTITTLVDQTGNGYDLTGTGVYEEKSIGQLPCLLVSKTDNAGFKTTSSDILSGESDAYAFMLIFPTDHSENAWSLYLDDQLSFQLINTSSTNWFRVKNSALANSDGGNILEYCPYINGIRTNGSSLFAYQNGTELFEFTSLSTSNFPSTITTFAINSDGNSNNMDGKIAEVIIGTGVLSDADREKIEGYLAHKWNQHRLLPSGHSYKDGPPLL